MKFGRVKGLLSMEAEHRQLISRAWLRYKDIPNALRPQRNNWNQIWQWKEARNVPDNIGHVPSLR